MYGARVPRVWVYLETNPGWLELLLTGTNFHDPSLLEPLKFYCIYKHVNTGFELERTGIDSIPGDAAGPRSAIGRAPDS